MDYGDELDPITTVLLSAAWNGAHSVGFLRDGHYVYPKVEGPLPLEDVQRHLNGEAPCTLFIAEPGGATSRLLVFDFDNKEKYERRVDEAQFDDILMRVLNALEERNVPKPLVSVSTSGTGRHIWCLFRADVDVGALRALALEVLHDVGLTEGKGEGVGAGEVEIFINPAHGVALPMFGDNAILSNTTLAAVEPQHATITLAAPPKVQVPAPAPQRRRERAEQPDNEPALLRQVVDALRYLSPEDYDTWVEIGLAIKGDLGEEGKEAWLEWSRGGTKFDELEAVRKWNQLKPTGAVTCGTLFHLATQEGWQPKHLTDLGNAYRLVEQFGADLRYVRRIKVWLRWTGDRWLEDDGISVAEAARETVVGILRDAAEARDEQRQRNLMKWGLNSQAAGRLEAMVRLASDDRRLCVYPEQMDADPYLLGVENGVLDLRAGTLLAPTREQLVTKQAAVAFDRTARCDRWLAFLDEVMCGDAEMVAYLKRVLGYTLTGDISEQAMWILYGIGNNGKSVLVDVLMRMLGDYAVVVAPDTLLVKRGNDNIPNDVARLHGARLVTCGEPEDGRALKEGLVKSVTGGDRITARYLRKEFFDFYPQFKLFLVTNHKPHIRGDDVGIWRRLRLVGFDWSVPAEKRDKHLTTHLLAERSGILNWLLEGCLEWQRSALAEPEKVRKATAQYRHDEDDVRQFVRECCMKAEGKTTRIKYLHEAYKAWCADEGRIPKGKTKLGERLHELGYPKQARDSTGNTVFHGIRLAGDAHQDF